MRLQVTDEPSCSPQNCERRIHVIQPFLRPGGVGAELGVFKGAFSEHLLGSQPQKLYLVDPWYRLAPQWNWARGEKSTLDAFLRILAAFRSEIGHGQVEPVVEFSESFLTTLPDDHLDWIYIDTSHKYEQTLKEVSLSLRKVRNSGYIMGDDFYFNKESIHHGVYRAVKELESNNKIRIIVEGVRQQFVAQGV